MTLAEQQQALDSLLNAIEAQDEEAIDNAVFTITEARQQETAVIQIGPILTDNTKDPDVRLSTIYALNVLEHKSATPFLGQALVDPANDPDIRNASLGVLDLLDPIGGLQYFRQLLSDNDPNIKDKGEFSFNFTLQKVTESSQAKEILNDAQITVPDLVPFLSQNVNNWEPGTNLIPATAAEALGILQNPDAIAPLFQTTRKLQLQQEHDAATEGASSTDNDATPEQQAQDSIMSSIVNALKSIGAPDDIVLSQAHITDVVSCLSFVLDNNLNDRIRSKAASSLGYLGYPQVITPLAKSLIHDSNRGVKTKAQQALKNIQDWTDKSALTIKIISDSPLQREQIDVQSIVIAIQPPDIVLDKEPNIFVNYLIETAVKNHQNSRLQQILAAFLIITTNNNTKLISDRLDYYHEEEKVSEKILQELRTEIGGATLKPLLKQLEDNLQKYFQEPLDELNKDTRKVWKTTITLANIGFIVRVLMSIAIFSIGAYLILDSYRLFANGEFNTEQAFGTGTSFFTGIGIIIATFWKFPLKEIKRAVSDVGLANVAFISFVHRVLQVSHTFSYYYLNGEISFGQLKRVGEIIEDTSNETILILEMSGSPSEEQSELIRILLSRLDSPPREETPI